MSLREREREKKKRDRERERERVREREKEKKMAEGKTKGHIPSAKVPGILDSQPLGERKNKRHLKKKASVQTNKSNNRNNKLSNTTKETIPKWSACTRKQLYYSRALPWTISAGVEQCIKTTL